MSLYLVDPSAPLDGTVGGQELNISSSSANLRWHERRTDWMRLEVHLYPCCIKCYSADLLLSFDWLFGERRMHTKQML